MARIDPETEESGQDVMLMMAADGITAKKIAEHFGVGRTYLFRYIHKHCKAEWDVALEFSAEAHVDDAKDILDGAVEESAAVAKAQAQARFRQWLAARRNRKAFGEDSATKQAAPVLNIQNLHLQALLQHGGVPPQLTDGEAVDVTPGETNGEDAS